MWVEKRNFPSILQRIRICNLMGVGKEKKEKMDTKNKDGANELTYSS